MRGFLSSANNLLWSTTKSQNIKDKGDKNYMHIEKSWQTNLPHQRFKEILTCSWGYQCFDNV